MTATPAYFATVDGNGVRTGQGLYVLGVDAIPSGAVAVPAALYAQLSANPDLRLVAGAAMLPLPKPAPAPTIAQQAAAMAATGCQVTSASAPALNDTYAVDPVTILKLTSLSHYISVNGKFPAGQSVLPWPNAARTRFAAFTSTAQFQQLATALADFVTEIDLAVDGASTTLPSSSKTIS